MNEYYYAIDKSEEEQFSSDLTRLLQKDIFTRKEGLTSGERCAQAYNCLLEIGKIAKLKEMDIVLCSDKLLQLHEWTGFVSGTVLTLLTIHYNLCLGTILATKSKTQNITPLISDLLAMNCVGVFLATELGYGNNVIKLKTTATFNRDSRTFTINTPCAEAKKFMPNTAYQGVPKIACVLARLNVGGKDQGVFPFIVPLRSETGAITKGVHITPLGEKPGYDLDNAITWFDCVAIPERFGLLGDDIFFNENGDLNVSGASVNKRFYRSIGRVQMGKLCLSGGIANGLKAIVKLVYKFSQRRLTFGPAKNDITVATYLLHRNAIIRLLTQVVAIDAFYQSVKTSVRRTDDNSINELNLAILKSYVSDTALSVLAEARQRVGAQGLFSESGIIDHIISVHGVVTAEGDNLVIRQKAASELVQKKLFEKLIPRNVMAKTFRIDELYSLKDQKLFIEALLSDCFDKAQEKLQKPELNQSRFSCWNNAIETSIRCLDAFTFFSVHCSLVEQLNSVADAQEHASKSALITLFFLDNISVFHAEIVSLGLLPTNSVTEIPQLKRVMLDIVYENSDKLIALLEIPDEIQRSPLNGDFIDTYNKRSGALPRQYEEH